MWSPPTSNKGVKLISRYKWCASGVTDILTNDFIVKIVIQSYIHTKQRGREKWTQLNWIAKSDANLELQSKD